MEKKIKYYEILLSKRRISEEDYLRWLSEEDFVPVIISQEEANKKLQTECKKLMAESPLTWQTSSETVNVLVYPIDGATEHMSNMGLNMKKIVNIFKTENVIVYSSLSDSGFLVSPPSVITIPKIKVDEPSDN